MASARASIGFSMRQPPVVTSGRTANPKFGARTSTRPNWMRPLQVHQRGMSPVINRFRHGGKDHLIRQQHVLVVTDLHVQLIADGYPVPDANLSRFITLLHDDSHLRWLQSEISKRLSCIHLLRAQAKNPIGTFQQLQPTRHRGRVMHRRLNHPEQPLLTKPDRILAGLLNLQRGHLLEMHAWHQLR